MALSKELLDHGVAFRKLSITFTLPPNTILLDQWNQIETQRHGCRVTLGLTHDKLTIDIDPGLLVDAQWPMSDVLWSGLVYTFANAKAGPRVGGISKISARAIDSIAIGSTQSIVKNEITTWVNDLLRGTRYAKPLYNPLDDPDPRGGLDELQKNMIGRPNNSKVELDKIRGIGATGILITRTTVRKEQGEYGVEINDLARFEIKVETDRSLAQLANKDFRISRIDFGIGKNGMFILRRGRRLIMVRQISVTRGGRVSLEHHELMVSPESLVVDKVSEKAGISAAELVGDAMGLFTAAEEAAEGLGTLLSIGDPLSPGALDAGGTRSQRPPPSASTVSATVNQIVRELASTAMTEALLEAFFKYKSSLRLMFGSLTEQQIMNILGIKQPGVHSAKQQQL